MDKAEYAYRQLLKGVQDYVAKSLENINRDITSSATIQDVNGDGTYNILLANVLYKRIKTIGGQCKKNESVKVLIPQGQYSNMFILKASDSELKVKELEAKIKQLEERISALETSAQTDEGYVNG